MELIMMNRDVSATLSALRRQRGLSQRAAAADLHISQALLSHYENGAREPGLAFISRACDYYGVTADFLLGRSDSETGGEASLISSAALTALTSALRARDNNSLTAAADRLVTAALLKVASRVTDDDPAVADTLTLETGAAELELLRAIKRLEGSGDAPALGAEARRLVADIRARLL